MPPSSPSGSLSRRTALSWLSAILGLSLVLRLALVPGRWINPDEGAHLMDGRLVLDGLLPFVDFGSRQIAYTYVLAGLIRLTRDGYAGVRLALAALTVANIYLVYLIARRLFDDRAATASALLYAAQPLAVIWAPIVHTEPVAIFPTCLGVYCLIRHLQVTGDRRFLVLAGVALSLAYYARESTLAVTAACALVLGVESWRRPGLLLRRLGLLGLGFLVPCVGFSLLYLGRLTAGGWWESRLNPLSIVLEHLPKLGTARSTARWATPADAVLRAVQPRVTTIAYLPSVAFFCSGLLAALAASLALRAGRYGSDWWRQGQLRADVLLYSWVGGLAAAYGYWVRHRGFFPQYGEEFLPPLAIVGGAVTADLFRLSLAPQRFSLALGVLGAYLAVTFAVGHIAGAVPAYLCVLLPALGFSLAELRGAGRPRTWLLLAAGCLVLVLLASPAVAVPVAARRGLKLAAIALVAGGTWLGVRAGERRNSRLLALGAAAALVAVLGWSSGRAGAVMDLKYETVWPTETVRSVADLLRHESTEGDRVMSGGVIWEFEAGLRPFAGVSHPLGFAADAPPGSVEHLARQFAAHPPRFVVLDGYTEKTYGRMLPGFDDTLAARYLLVRDLPGIRYPVRVYRLREAVPAP